jgi:hypothetical protein
MREPTSSCKSRKDLEARLQQLLQTHSYSPFYLLSLDTLKQTGFWLWTTRDLQSIKAQPIPFFTTSSLHPDIILPFRQETAHATISNQGLSAQTLKDLHLSTGIPASEKTIKMSRHDARTVSYTHICVTQDLATLRYAERDTDLDFKKPVSIELPLS